MSKNKTTKYTMTITLDVYDDDKIYTVDTFDMKITDLIMEALVNLKPDYIKDVEWTSLKAREGE
jgi:Fe-S cluster assembly iron-binding protein IscA